MQITYTEGQLQEVVKQIIIKAKSKTICFYGEMGAGKTTLIKEFIKELGSMDNPNSPTYGIVNEYNGKTGDLLAYHFDFYRLNNETEALDLGLEDYLSADAWILIEWPEMVKSLLPNDKTEVYIEILSPNTRKLTILD
ncbi:tRNA threonylcarbamoyladenosine biosynthesis protein TsaE [Saonia flava]|uniref:tRNA threonylcarbamoyladenosine biosynthesis protein TsaE n=1 Tax=Saonia flava TaxID=523696 RepID=A0A846QRE7_9FLAO|nr:tRNA (adenosine(37)-N6)-threonylcarbamoyltransferase complex ATPase subunit type 1 TsaE [Saonia flava]NJB69767.1 tRNA threonylcarbamoyladenosine biosynthesis protein TsaE [Saonia flava]